MVLPSVYTSLHEDNQNEVHLLLATGKNESLLSDLTSARTYFTFIINNHRHSQGAGQ